ncbi:MAG: exonuclease [Magnetococcales bacterium]|nr:exonuclease [Magnetococcales bacterium]
MLEIYVSTDVETDGPIPGPHSMLSFASAAYLEDKTLISTFSANLETLPNADPHPDTAAWWKKNPQAWTACRREPLPPGAAMNNYLFWLKTLPGKPVFVAYPAVFDFLFVHWYLIRFTGESPFGHNAVDIRTYAMALLKTKHCDSGKRHLPDHWFDDLPHSHVALDDAIEQGALFCNMLRENKLK